MSAIEGLGQGLKGGAKLLLFTCIGPYHFWPYRAFMKCRCLCGRYYYAHWGRQSKSVIFATTHQGRSQGWRKRGLQEYTRKEKWKEAKHETTFVFNPYTGARLVA